MAAALYHVKKRIVFGPEGAETMYFCHAREQGHDAIINSLQFLTNHKEKIKSAYREGHCPCEPRDYSPCRIGSKVAPLCGEGITCPRAWQRYKVRHPKGLTNSNSAVWQAE